MVENDDCFESETNASSNGLSERCVAGDFDSVTRTPVLSDKRGADVHAFPTIISFAAGDSYYFRAADALEANCEALGLPHEIVRWENNELDWDKLCRLKIKFLREMSEKHGAILWTDVDNSILKIPRILAHCSFDMVGFAGRFEYIRDYDRYDSARFWIPSVLYFSNSPRAKRFIDLLVRVESETVERVTDDWVLHEAWLRHDFQMAVGFLPPSIIARKREGATQSTVFVYGESGNVAQFKSKVVQHANEGEDPRLRSKMFVAEARRLMLEKRSSEALQFSKRAVEVCPANDEAIIQYSRYLRLSSEKQASLEVLEKKRAEYGDHPRLLEELARRYQQFGEFEASRDTLRDVRAANDPEVSPKVDAYLYELELEERASRQGIPLTHRPRMWWKRTPYPGTIGQALGPWIIENLTGVPPYFGRRETALLAVGSIIKYATATNTIWGAGILRRDEALAPDSTYQAVRGPLTREAVLKSGGECSDVYGDPTLLLPSFYNPEVKSPDHKLGLVRHASHQNREMRFDEVKDISLVGVGDAAIRKVVDDIRNCEAILSTSLEGLIIANAYGVPARWCRFSDDPNSVPGDGIEFHDYFQSVKVEDQEAFDLAGLQIYGTDLRKHVPSEVNIKFDADRLIEALAIKV